MHTYLEKRSWRVWFKDPWHIELHWGRLSFAIEYGIFCSGEDAHLHLAVPGIEIWICGPLTAKQKAMVDIPATEQTFNGWGYGINISGRHLTIYTGLDDGKPRNGFWLYEWPWRRWHHVRHEVLTPSEVHPYLYTLRNKQIQIRTAKIQVEEREWRWMWKASSFKKVQRYIDIKFNDEVGEQTGSWKGGTIGCGFNMLKGETPLQCLRRMENERRFE